MEKTESHADQAESAPRRRWPRSLLSGAVFGGLGAAAGNWLAGYSGARGSLRQWVTVISGAFTAIIATYGSLKSSAEEQREKKAAALQKAEAQVEQAPPPDAASRMRLQPETPDTKITSASAMADKLRPPEHVASL